jgi:DNA-binding transcriptional MerR regulator
MQEIEEIQKSLRHRSFNPESEQHQKFLAKLQQKIKVIEDKWSHIKF